MKKKFIRIVLPAGAPPPDAGFKQGPSLRSGTVWLKEVVLQEPDDEMAAPQMAAPQMAAPQMAAAQVAGPQVFNMGSLMGVLDELRRAGFPADVVADPLANMRGLLNALPGMGGRRRRNRRATKKGRKGTKKSHRRRSTRTNRK